MRAPAAPARALAPASTFAATFVLALAASGCGDRLVHRALEVDVDGVSRMAEVVVLAAFPKSTQRDCSNVSQSNVLSLEPPYLSRWVRSSGAERLLALPEIDEDEVTLVVYTQDAAGAAIQFTCANVTYAQIEDGVISLRLPPVTASIIRPCPSRTSDRSSSSACSVAAGWPRSSSPTAAASPIAWSSSASAPISRPAPAAST